MFWVISADVSEGARIIAARTNQLVIETVATMRSVNKVILVADSYQLRFTKDEDACIVAKEIFVVAVKFCMFCISAVSLRGAVCGSCVARTNRGRESNRAAGIVHPSRLRWRLSISGSFGVRMSYRAVYKLKRLTHVQEIVQVSLNSNVVE